MKRAKAISFDVFDTLVQRPVESPKDVFYIVELLALEMGLRVPKFCLIRPEAEQEARLDTAHGEVTLDGIYAKIQALYGLTGSQLAELRDLEVEVELQLCKAKPAGFELWKKAQSLGLPIILTSDMYLPAEVISQICTNAGYSGWQKLYLSSENATSKSRGGLFDIVVRELGIQPSELIHIGDNWKADILRARERSIQTIWLPNPASEFRKSKLRSKTGGRHRRLVPDLTRSFYISLVSQRVLSNRGAKLSTRDVGYLALGPCVHAYASWLATEAKQRGVSKLYFLSRDTSLFLKAYEILAGDDPGGGASSIHAIVAQGRLSAKPANRRRDY